MGLFSAIGGILGLGSTDNAYDRMREGLTTAQQALDKGLTDTETRLQPTAQVGTDAITRLSDILLKGDMSKFYDNPAYAYNKEQSERGIQANAAAKGTLMSGNTLKELQKNASGLASQNYGSFIQNLSNLFNQANPYLTAYDQVPYTRGQNNANFAVAQGNASRDAQLAKGQQIQGIMGGLDQTLMSAINPMAGFMSTLMGGGGVNPNNMSWGQVSQQPWQSSAGIPEFGTSYGFGGF